jgi:hypothetical protein
MIDAGERKAIEQQLALHVDRLAGLIGPPTLREDSPRSETYQLDLLHCVGFAHFELQRKNSCFAAFGAWKE